MDILIGILTVVEVLVCLLLILVVLMQRPRQEGLGASFGDGMMSQIAGAQTTNVLQKFTVYLAVGLFILTLSLAMLVTRKQSSRANTQLFSAPAPAAVEAPKVEEKPAAPAPAAPAEAPKSGEAKPAVETSPPTKPLQEAVKKEAAPAAPAEKKAEAPAPAKQEEPKSAPAAPAPAPAPAVPAPTPAPAPAAPATTPAPAPAAPAAPATNP
ncbi:preprotein translocase subunit SecG [Prosthecobacter debontii]|uniref:Protein-export membrane protein SecG n=1 Tax=Prosthecobacter debontii TaxID=48467 RepID=A0A1T4X471_9BACT|nr:preprotein translocase subunit SecG [Prosthecobacter debontii]SKA84229.1 preprotein translocase subunit SecG [Prosthecobacter debontii]